MAILDYNKRIANLQNRRFDQVLNESALSKSFDTQEIPENVVYLLESMKPIGDKYNAKTEQAAEAVRRHLEAGLKVHFQRVYRTQGSVRTNTNIRIHSDIDLLAIIDKYFYPQTSKGPDYTESDPNVDIVDLRSQSTNIMKAIYDNVDDSGDKCIRIENKNLNRMVDIVFAYWYNSDKYDETKNEHYRGVYLYNFSKKTKQRDYPFATIGNINYRGHRTNDGLRMGIRLLKNLRADCDTELNSLKSFQLTSIVYSIDDEDIYNNHLSELKIAKAISAKMGRIIDDPVLRKSIKSPNGIELPLYDDSMVPDIVTLKQDLDNLIADSSSEIIGSTSLQRSILNY